MNQPTPEELTRARDARLFAHRETCPPPRNRLEDGCPACPTGTGTLLALRHLDEKPRDAKGARRRLHDVVCMSSCPPEDSDHADRTQAGVVASLRRFRAQEA